MTLRRGLLALYSLVFIAACGGLIGLVWNEDEKLDLDISNDFNLQAFVAATDSAQILSTTVLGILIVFGLWTLIMSLLPAGGAGASSGMLRLKQSDGGTVEVTSQALERLVREEVEALPEVRQAVPRVKVSGGAVDTDALVVIEPQESIAHVTTVVNDAINRAYKEQVGVSNVKRPNIRISYEPVKGRPLSDGAAPRRVEAARAVPAGPAGEGEAVTWPPPPPDVRRNDTPERNDTADEDPPAAPVQAPWNSEWDTGAQAKPNDAQPKPNDAQDRQ